MEELGTEGGDKNSKGRTRTHGFKLLLRMKKKDGNSRLAYPHYTELE